jgi:8-oxo-dGTP pyrophosphatase MutT (NUDIX family)
MPVVLAPEAVDLVVARALIERRGRLLLVRRAGWDTMPMHWELPGGKVSPGESDRVAVARELAEETGLELTGVFEQQSAFRMRSPSGRRVEERVFRVEASGGVRLSDEHDDHLWWSGAPVPGPLTTATARALAHIGARSA